MARHRNAGGPYVIFEPGLGITGSLDVTGIASVTGSLALSEISSPAAPANGAGGKLYTKADGKPYWISNELGETDLTAVGTVAGFTDDLSTVYLTTSTDKVGIGTTTPTNKLVVEVADSENIGGVYVDFNETGNYNAVYVDSEASYPAIAVKGKQGMRIEQDLTSGYGLLVDRNIAEAGSSPLVSLVDDHTQNTQPTLRVQQDGTGPILRLFGGAQEVFAVSTIGNVTAPHNCLVSAYLDADVNNVAINTTTTVVFDVELYDTQGCYNTGTGIFTAPVDGHYHVTAHVRLDNLDSAATYYKVQITNNGSHDQDQFYHGTEMTDGDVAYTSFVPNAIVQLDANDTCYITVYQSGGTAQTDINGAANTAYTSRFQIRLVQ